MNLIEAIQTRHSVREYSMTFLSQKVIDDFNQEIEKINQENDLHIQFFNGNPDYFQSKKTNYGHFKNVMNYFAMVGPQENELDELIGYYGEHLVLKAQQYGLNTCWVGMPPKDVHKKVKVEDGEKFVCLITIGYGLNQGKTQKKKPVYKICPNYKDMPDWFKAGVDCAILAPSAMNQQKFKFYFEDSKVEIRPGFGPFSKVDAGIAKYHFEVGAGTTNINWLD